MHWDLGSLAGTLGVLIPVIAIGGGLATGIVAIVTDHRRRREIYEMHHKERMFALERGLELPPLPANLIDDDHVERALADTIKSSRPRRYRNALRSGLTWLFVGIGLGAALYLNAGVEQASWALIPIGLGLAKLIYHFASGDSTAPPQQPTAGR
jgi:hypothetical protein